MVIAIEELSCRVCGCTDDDCYCCYVHSDDDDCTWQGCWWVEPDLCSSCAEAPVCPGIPEDVP